MSRLLPPLNALRAFEAAGRHESFSGAAAELGVSHSAISRHVRGLEHRLGAQLFRDLARGVALTQAGARYLAQVTPALDMIAEATEEFSDQPAGRLLVNAEPLFAAKFLMPRLSQFTALYPQIELRVEVSQKLANLDRYEADLAIRSVATGAPEQASELISNAWSYVYGAPSLVGQGLENAADVLNFRRLQDRRGNPWADWADRAGLARDAFPTPDWRMRAALAVEAALAGQGLFLCTEEIVSDACARGALVKCLAQGTPAGSYHLIFGEGVRRRVPVRAFRDWLLDQASAFRTGASYPQPNG